MSSASLAITEAQWSERAPLVGVVPMVALAIPIAMATPDYRSSKQLRPG